MGPLKSGTAKNAKCGKAARFVHKTTFCLAFFAAFAVVQRIPVKRGFTKSPPFEMDATP